MNESEKKNFRHAMHEAALLETGNPLRQKLENEIAGKGKWAEDEWLLLLLEYEQLRLDLQRVAVPQNLGKRLLILPDELSLRDTGLGRRWLAVAAVLLLITGGALLLKIPKRHPPVPPQLRIVSFLALDDHLNDRSMTIKTDNINTLKQTLLRQTSLQVNIPKLDSGFHLLGGRKCFWANNLVIYTLWEKNGKKYSIIQFNCKEFGLPENMGKEVICYCKSFQQQSGRRKSNSDVLVWSQQGRGYALVSGHQELLKIKL